MNTQLILLLIITLAVFTYLYLKKNKEYFNNQINNQINNVSDEDKEIQDTEYLKKHFQKLSNQKCPSANFYTSDNKYCANIKGVMKGCQEFPKGEGREPWMGAFSVFGGYLTQVDDNNKNECASKHGETLSQWGLCDKERLTKILEFGTEGAYKENQKLVNAIENACSLYKMNV